MSNIYIQEPPTSGKVLLKTTVGDIDIELWSKETPKACRNFIQLCLEGYYDGLVFHRIVKDFIAQGGDPTGTGNGGESIYGKPFRDEPHSRLRFVRRGLVAMANSGKNDNGSQFFFTLGPTQELQNVHTIFGKVAGDTIYNMIKLNDVSVDSNDRPYEPPKIKRTEVLANPFTDMVPRATIKHEKDKKSKKLKSQSTAKKDYKLLSFGEEAEAEEETLNLAVHDMRHKGKSAHDLANDPKLSNAVVTVENSRYEEDDDAEAKLESVRNKLKAYEQEKVKPAETSRSSPHFETIANSSGSRTEKLKTESRKLMKELQSRSKTKPADDEDAVDDDKEESDTLSEYKNVRKMYKQKRQQKGGDRESLTLKILANFKQRLDTAKTMTEKYGEEDMEVEEGKEEESDAGWLGHKLEFSDHHVKVLDANVTDVDRYEIYDPRNPMTKRRREESKKESKNKKKKSDVI